MIRALFGFVLTLGLLGAGALWALRSFNPAELLRATPPPVSRTVELLAAEITRQVQADGAPDRPDRAPPPDVATATRSEESTHHAAPEGLAEASAPLPGEVAEDIAGADPAEAAETAAPGDPSGALADSAVLVRRMLGLYNQSLEP